MQGDIEGLKQEVYILNMLRTTPRATPRGGGTPDTPLRSGSRIGRPASGSISTRKSSTVATARSSVPLLALEGVATTAVAERKEGEDAGTVREVAGEKEGEGGEGEGEFDEEEEEMCPPPPPPPPPPPLPMFSAFDTTLMTLSERLQDMVDMKGLKEKGVTRESSETLHPSSSSDLLLRSSMVKDFFAPLFM